MKLPLFLFCIAAGCTLAAADVRGRELFDRNRTVPEEMGSTSISSTMSPAWMR